jgi:hypothetical protein
MFSRFLGGFKQLERLVDEPITLKELELEALKKLEQQ